jgi:hypothetical protein
MKKRNVKIIGLLGCLSAILSFEVCMAQNASYKEIMHDLKGVQKNFSTPEGSYASCLVIYLYSTQSSPSTYVDSLNGQYKSFGQNHYTKIGNTETIQNDSMALVVYNDDKLIMGGAIASSPRKDRGLFLSAMDSDFVAHNAGVMTISRTGGLKTMEFRFNDSSQYYNCRLIYDAETYVPKSIRYMLRKSIKSGVAIPTTESGLITIEFSGYSSAPFDRSVLNVNKYVRVTEAGKGTLQPAYSNYQWIEQGKMGMNATGN